MSRRVPRLPLLIVVLLGLAMYACSIKMLADWVTPKVNKEIHLP